MGLVTVGEDMMSGGQLGWISGFFLFRRFDLWKIRYTRSFSNRFCLPGLYFENASSLHDLIIRYG